MEPGEAWHQLVVRRRAKESPDTVSFMLASTDGATLPRALPGQYVSVAVTLADGARQIRQYSLTRASISRSGGSRSRPSVRWWPTTVPGSRPVRCHFLALNVFEGDQLTISPPFGDLALEDGPEPLLLISAGIGSTPIIGMLHYIARSQTERQVTVLHADRSPARHAHRQELADLVGRLPGSAAYHWYEDLGRRRATGTTKLGLIDLGGSTCRRTPRCICAVRCRSWSWYDGPSSSGMVPEKNIHYEVFGPDTWLPGA